MSDPHSHDHGTKKKVGVKPYIKPLSTAAGLIVIFILFVVFSGNGCSKQPTTTSQQENTQSHSVPIFEIKSIDYCEGTSILKIPSKKALLVNLKNCSSSDKFKTTKGPSPVCINETTGESFLTSDPVWGPGLNWRLENRSSVEVIIEIQRVKQ